jgi:hypothetical protein
MAIGIEDNSAKDKSKVCIYDLSNPENPPSKPIVSIERSGDSLRATAGCVGLTKYKSKLLVVVGDWGTKHLDFYSCNYGDLSGEFGLVYSLDTDSVSKKDWINEEWVSYQNINLFTFGNSELFLVGLGQNRGEKHVADLYRFDEDDSGNFTIVKVASKIFNCEKGASFKAGAGVEMGGDGEPGIISCGYHLEDTSYLNYFNFSKGEK